MKHIKKRCVICRRKLKIPIKDKKGQYIGGHYFGKVEFYKRYRITGKYSKFGMKFGIAKGIGKLKTAEYWECEKCFNE